MNWPSWTRRRQPESDTCETIDPLMSLYADGMASAEESRRVDLHLPGCASCRQSLLWIQATQRALSARPVVSPPADLRARIAQSLPAALLHQTPVRRPLVLRPAFAAAFSLSLVGIVVGYSLLKPSSPAPVLPVKPSQIAVVPSLVASASGKPLHPVRPKSSPKPFSPRAVEAARPADTVSEPLRKVILTPPRKSLGYANPEREGNILAAAPLTPRPLVPVRHPALKAILLLANKNVPQPREDAPKPSSPSEGDHSDWVAIAPPAPSVSVAIESPRITSEPPAPVQEASVVSDSHSRSLDMLSAVRERAKQMQSDALTTTRASVRQAVYVAHTAALDSSATIDITHGDLH